MRVIGLISLMLYAAIGSGVDFHPDFLWKDSAGLSVAKGKAPLSLTKTCGTCHDVNFIETHGSHSADLSGKSRYLKGIFAPTDSIAYIKWQRLMGHRLPGGPSTDKELNCLLCHSQSLLDTTKEPLTWNPQATHYRKKGQTPWLPLGKPQIQNCGQCHGFTPEQTKPLLLPEIAQGEASLWQSGFIYSSQKISQSGLNISGKKSINQSWDVHAKRGLKCTDCHSSPGNPGRPEITKIDGPARLKYDARRNSLAEYLYRPDHRLVSGGVYTSGTSKSTILDCSNCHEAKHTGNWAYRNITHFEKLSCQACHIPFINSPVLQSVDASVLDESGEPQLTFRNVDSTGLIVPWRPMLLRREVKSFPDGRTNHGKAFYPFNPVTFTLWVNEDRPIDRDELKAAQASLNQNSPSAEAITKALKKMGYSKPMLRKEVRPFPISHNATESKWATRDCQACHSDQSILQQTISLETSESHLKPILANNNGIHWESQIVRETGIWKLKQDSRLSRLYVFGKDHLPLVDWLGMAIILLVILGVMAHGSFRIILGRKNAKAHSSHPEKKVYMYTLYERFWHWMQAMTVFLLLGSGLEIHLPSTIQILGSEKAGWLHHGMGIILGLNAFLAMFYHFASGEIRQYLPKPEGFFNQAIHQAIYYTQGMFKGHKHPFQKDPQNKLNPLQKLTYLGLFNILLPILVLSGFLMLLQNWTGGFNELFGGLAVIATIHTASAWSMAAFLIMHVYLTTTGNNPTEYVKGMITGWESGKHEES